MEGALPVPSLACVYPQMPAHLLLNKEADEIQGRKDELFKMVIDSGGSDALFWTLRVRAYGTHTHTHITHTYITHNFMIKIIVIRDNWVKFS